MNLGFHDSTKGPLEAMNKSNNDLLKIHSLSRKLTSSARGWVSGEGFSKGTLLRLHFGVALVPWQASNTCRYGLNLSKPKTGKKYNP